MTKSADGLILYNGPIVRPDEGFQVDQDFISLELIKGYIRLLIDFGSGTKGMNSLIRLFENKFILIFSIIFRKKNNRAYN